MMMSLRRKIFYGFTISVLALLLILPSTGWLARLQLLPFGPQNADVKALTGYGVSSTSAQTADQQMADFVATRPNDFEAQFAYAMSASSDVSLQRLEALDSKFPNNPTVIAARLTRMTQGRVRVNRAEENLLSPEAKRPPTTTDQPKPSDPAAVAAFVTLAEQGERVAPNNGFFPVMVALGEFARHQDDAAIAAWKRAGSKPDWDDYTLAEMNAKWQLQTERNHGTEVGFVPRTATMAAILFPHYAAIRASARMATVEAFQAELAGRTEDGFALRAATRHIGATMMAKNSTFIGVLVGRAIVAIAGNRPGGAEPLERHSSKPEDVARQDKAFQERYAAYLTSIGHSEEITAFAASSRDGDTIRKICQDGMSNTYVGFGVKTFRLLAFWYGDILLLAGVLASLTFAGIFKIVYRFSPRLQQGEPLQPSSRWGISLGLLLPFFGGLIALTTTPYWADNNCDLFIPSSLLSGGVFVALALVLVVPPLVQRMPLRSVLNGLLVMVGTIHALALIGAVGALTWYLFSGQIGLTGMIQGLSGGSDGDGTAADKNVWLIVLPAVISLVMVTLPLLLLGLFALFSRILRIPVSAGVTRGMRAMAVPLACFLALSWGICLLGTVQHENAALHELKRMGQVGEPRMNAELLGRAYPEMKEAQRIP